MPILPRPLAALLLGTALACLGLPAAAQPSSSAGAYLAARHAATANDFAAAALWHEQALAADPENPVLLEGAVTAHLALGQIEQAAALGQRLLDLGDENQIAWLAVLADMIRKGDFAAIVDDQQKGRSIGALVDHLILAWAELGKGSMSEAEDDFDKIIATPGTGAFGLYHKALALAASGDFEGADRLLSDPRAASLLQLNRAVLARVQILSQLERNADAVTLLDRVYGPRLDAPTADLRRRLAAGEPVAFDVVQSPADGLAEVFFSLATALGSDSDQTYVLLYTRIAATLRPDLTDAQMMTANLLTRLDQFDLAEQAFAAVPATSPAYVAARIGQADAAQRADRLDDAVALLKTLAADRPADEAVLTALGDALRRKGDCDQAIAAYSSAIAALPALTPAHWPMLYKRAGCYVIQNDWPKAEADFKNALTLAPDEPRLLNELGYSWVDRGVNLDQALEMIQRAVAASPDTGYIVDSLAWAYYRLGRFDEAVAPQEKAAQLMPLDPIVTDHLGDIYWQVGRKREAMFQWRRALSYEPEDKDAARIKRKLEVGLDQVLAEEQAAGTHAD